jgi:O-antigen ligase
VVDGSAGVDGSALLLFGVGAVSIVLAASPFKLFDLDRFFVPKELVLHLTATVAAVTALQGRLRLPLSRVDTLLVAYLLWSAASAGGAVNPWLSARALAISLSGAALFWSARGARGTPASTLLPALVAGVVAASAASLLQAYGVTSDLFSLNRVPGGTMGNRNFVAHLCALALPLALLTALTTSRRWTSAVSMGAVAIMSATVVLTRSRAAWLALAVCAVVSALAIWRLRWSVRGVYANLRAMLLVCAALAGVTAALLLPNHLEWKSDSPYLDSVTGVVNYREGSGRGRLVQYANTVRLIAAHPVLGVGPGNWAVEYPRYAPSDDPSLDRETGMTANPWPSSDWAAIAAERGPIALLLMLLILLGLVVTAWRSAEDAETPRDAANGIALLAVVTVTLVVGAFDAALLLAAPSYIIWSALGSLAPTSRRRATLSFVPSARHLWMAAIALVGALAAVRSATQLLAMNAMGEGTRVSEVDRAATLDPGSYRIQLRAADIWFHRGRCERARIYADRAHGLFPSAPAPKRIVAECRGKPRS